MESLISNLNIRDVWRRNLKMAHSSSERNEVHCCQLTFIRATLFSSQLPSPFSPVNADMRCAKAWFGCQGRQRRGRTAWHNSPKPSYSLWKQDNCWQVFTSAYYYRQWITTGANCDMRTTCLSFYQVLGSHSMPSSGLCSTRTKHSGTCFYLPPHMPAPLGITRNCGWIQRSSLKVWECGWAELLGRLWKWPPLRPCKKIVCIWLSKWSYLFLHLLLWWSLTVLGWKAKSNLTQQKALLHLKRFTSVQRSLGRTLEQLKSPDQCPWAISAHHF